jgi:hypothetical protein
LQWHWLGRSNMSVRHTLLTHINPILMACLQYLFFLTTISQDSHNPTHTQEMNLQEMLISFLEIKKKMIFILYEFKLLR